MKLGDLDIIGDPADGTLKLIIGGQKAMVFHLDANQTERLITYLKGLRDGLGWNTRCHADRSL